MPPTIRADAAPAARAGVVCVIPALNAEESVRHVVIALRRVIAGAIIVGVDDGSTDATRSVLRHCCDHIITFDANRGKGAALRAAFDYAVREHPGLPVLTVDADGQHDVAFAPRLLAALDAADIVIGVREIAAASVPAHRRVANRISTAAARLVTRVPLTDSQSGFRALRPQAVREVSAAGDRYEFETDFLVRASEAGFRIAEVQVPTIYGPPSHFRHLTDAWRVARVLWGHRGRFFHRS